VDNFEDINQRYDVSLAVASHQVGEPGVLLRYFSHKKVPCLKGIVGTGILRRYKSGQEDKLNAYHVHVDNGKIKDAAEEMGEESRLAAEANEYMRRRMISEEKTDADARNAFSGRILGDKKTLESTFGMPADQPCVFVLPHAFNDHPRSLHASNVFRDYYRWLIETLKFARDEQSVNWIFKEHPSTHRYPNDANLSGIFEVLDAQHVAFVEADENFNSKTILRTADAVVTHRGTAGLEYPSVGIPAVAVGESNYSELDVAHVAETKEEYFQLLGRVGQLPEVTDVQQRRARIALYLMQGVIRTESNNVGLGIRSFGDASYEEQDIVANIAKGIKTLSKGQGHRVSKFLNSDRELYVDDAFEYLHEEGVLY
jgi:hypothetical protein